MKKYMDCPQVLRDFLIYHETIKGQSPRTIDEYYLDDDYVFEQSQLQFDGKFTKDFSEFVLGDDEYFLLGDNRLHSSDSRVFGVFQKEDIVSKHVYVWYPFSEMRVVK